MTSALERCVVCDEQYCDTVEDDEPYHKECLAGAQLRTGTKPTRGPLRKKSGKILPLRVEAEFYIRFMLEGDPVRAEDRQQLRNLALLGLRVVVDRGDGGSIYFEGGKDYPE